jgi:septal ring-binding cell division protein DamX
MPEAAGFALVAFVELEPDGVVVDGEAGVELEDEAVVDELDVGPELAACSAEEHAPQTSANNPTARPTEVGPFPTAIEDRRPLLKLQLGIVGEMSMMSRLAGAINNQGAQSTPLTANRTCCTGAPTSRDSLVLGA